MNEQQRKTSSPAKRLRWRKPRLKIKSIEETLGDSTLNEGQGQGKGQSGGTVEIS